MLPLLVISSLTAMTKSAMPRIVHGLISQASVSAFNLPRELLKSESSSSTSIHTALLMISWSQLAELSTHSLVASIPLSTWASDSSQMPTFKITLSNMLKLVIPLISVCTWDTSWKSFWTFKSLTTSTVITEHTLLLMLIHIWAININWPTLPFKTNKSNINFILSSNFKWM